ncbi:hypothetical protein D3C85_1188890 [compost metagenome]
MVMTGITLGVAVLTWVLSSIKFQADMGILLGFMFIMEHDRCTGSCSGVSTFHA